MLEDDRSAEQGHEAGSDGVRAVPDGLFGGELGRADPVGHEAAAWRVSHSLGITIYQPKTSDEYYKSGRGFAFSVQEIEDAVHLRAQSDEDIDHGGKQKSCRHHSLPADAVCQESVHETRYSVDDAVQCEEESELRFADAEFGFERRHRDAEVLSHEIEQCVAYHEDYQCPPLPVIVLFDCLFVHVDDGYSLIEFQIARN